MGAHANRAKPVPDWFRNVKIVCIPKPVRYVWFDLPNGKTVWLRVDPKNRAEADR